MCAHANEYILLDTDLFIVFVGYYNAIILALIGIWAKLHMANAMQRFSVVVE